MSTIETKNNDFDRALVTYKIIDALEAGKYAEATEMRKAHLQGAETIEELLARTKELAAHNVRPYGDIITPLN